MTVFATGDVFNDLPHSAQAFRHLSPLLSQADIVFGNCEGVYTDTPNVAPSARFFHQTSRERGARLGAVPFHVMACANNHALDSGSTGLRDTLSLLQDQGIFTTGAGEDIIAATRPAVIQVGGQRVAFLSFCSAFPVGYEARSDRPGLAPLRVHTLYRSPDPAFWEPGIQAHIATSPHEEDLARFREAIKSAKRDADTVIVSCHWGYAPMMRDRMSPPGRTHRRIWSDGVEQYEIDLSRDAIDHGADAVVCHHQFSLRGVAFHRGKPIFHGLGVLVSHFRHGARGLLDDQGDTEFPLFPFAANCRRTGVAAITVGATGTVTAGFIPAQILSDGSTEPLRADDPRAEEIAAHLEAINIESGFDTALRRGAWDGWMMLHLKDAS